MNTPRALRGVLRSPGADINNSLFSFPDFAEGRMTRLGANYLVVESLHHRPRHPKDNHPMFL